MRKIIVLGAMLFFAAAAQSQVFRDTTRFAPSILKQDLAFLKEQLMNVHADPYSELTKEKYELLFNRIDASIKDSLTTIEFFKLIKPTVSYLSDEHADISLPKALAGYDSQSVFLPFTLRKVKKDYQVDSVLIANSGLMKGMVVKQVNQVPIEELVDRCATYTTGFPDQRRDNALIQFGYLYPLATPFRQKFTVTTAGKKSIEVNGIPFYTWLNYLYNLHGKPGDCSRMISYQKFGETGYINACSFGTRSDSAVQAYGRAVDSIFALVKRDQVKQVVVDVSQNSGGNSALGNFIIRQFYTGHCLTYQMNWKRSDAYLNTLKNWGIKNEQYERLQPGEVMHYGPDTSWIDGVKDPYKGKVYIMIGQGTFSSAIMFATTIKDNKIATLVGEEPKSGHPTHFGELYSVKLPNTQLAVRFGVKEWIRPLGKGVGNRLEPDVKVELNGGIEEVIGRLVR